MSTTLDETAKTLWKKWIVTGVVAGMTMAVLVSGIMGTAWWYVSEPKAWRSMGLSATGGEIGMVAKETGPSVSGRRPVTLTGYRVSYVVRNTGGRDITLSNTSLVRVRESEGALAELAAPTSFSPAYLPAGHSIRFNVNIGLDLSDVYAGYEPSDTSARGVHPLWSRLSLIGLDEDGIDGFVILDSSQHIELNLPKPEFGRLERFLELP